MREAYRQAMDHIAVTEEMRARILSNLQNPGLTGERRGLRRMSTRLFAAAACLALLLAGSFSLRLLPGAQPQRGEGPGVEEGLSGPEEAGTLQALSQAVGFQVTGLADLPFSPLEIRYTAFGGEMAQVQYVGEEQTVTFRQIAGSTDPSGDYTQYSDVRTLTKGELQATLRGEAGLYRLAVWQDGAYSYSARVSLPLAAEVWEAMLPDAG